MQSPPSCHSKGGAHGPGSASRSVTGRPSATPRSPVRTAGCRRIPCRPRTERDEGRPRTEDRSAWLRRAGGHGYCTTSSVAKYWWRLIPEAGFDEAALLKASWAQHPGVRIEDRRNGECMLSHHRPVGDSNGRPSGVVNAPRSRQRAGARPSNGAAVVTDTSNQTPSEQRVVNRADRRIRQDVGGSSCR